MPRTRTAGSPLWSPPATPGPGSTVPPDVDAGRPTDKRLWPLSLGVGALLNVSVLAMVDAIAQGGGEGTPPGSRKEERNEDTQSIRNAALLAARDEASTCRPVAAQWWSNSNVHRTYMVGGRVLALAPMRA